MCEQVFGEELRRAEALTGDIANSEAISNDQNDMEIRPLLTPLPCVRRTAQFLEGAEGLSEATSVVGLTTKTGAKLNLVFRRDANGVPTLDF